MSTRREGFAIPATLVVIGFLTIALMAAFSRVDSEYRITINRTAQVDAFTLAQTGLERFLVTRTTLGFTSVPPAPAESARIALTGGYADVVLTQIRDTVGGAIPRYLLRSRGTTTPPPRIGMRPAMHTVAQYVNWSGGGMQVLSGWTAIGGNGKNGNAGNLSGNDNCGAKPPVAGVAVPTGGWHPTGGFNSTGSPPVLEMGTQAQMASQIKIDWAGIVGQTSLVPDIIIPPSGWPSSFPANWWPVIYVNGDLSLPNSGRGTLIVTGDLTISGSRSWEGIILVGDKMTSNGNNTMTGAVVSGLNYLLGQTVEESDAGNGTKTYVYDSCDVASAASRFGALRPVDNTWLDNWSW